VLTLSRSGKAAALAIRERLQMTNPKVVWLSLGLLDFAMDKAGNNMAPQVGNNEFMQVMIQVLNNKEIH
jgi:hypothetical protein